MESEGAERITSRRELNKDHLSLKSRFIVWFLNTCVVRTPLSISPCPRYIYMLRNDFEEDIFFREIVVHGKENVPQSGPAIFVCAPHANQFLDPVIVMKGIKRKTGFLAAAVSMRKPIIGDIGRAMGSIPVERPQDIKFEGTGIVAISGDQVTGQGTKFLKQLMPGAIIIATKIVFIVKSVNSDTECTLKKAAANPLPSTTYQIIPKIDQDEVFDTVATKLVGGEAIGIFPEGGSHDRTDLLPLKAGVSIMAFAAMDLNPKIKLKIIPCGLNYFHGHKFRSQAYLDIGEPMTVPESLYEQYKKGGENKKEACSKLLDLIKEQLHSVTTLAKDYAALETFWTMRQIYTPGEVTLDIGEKIKITRRFAHAMEVLDNKEDVRQLRKHTQEYAERIKAFGLDDHQVRNANFSYVAAIFMLIYKVLFVVIAGAIILPCLILSTPLNYICKFVANKKAKQAKAGSSVKIAGRDVMATWMVLTATAVLPLLWIIYTVIFGVVVGLYNISLTVNGTTLTYPVLIVIFFFSLPLYGLFSVKISDTIFQNRHKVNAFWLAIAHKSDAKLLKQMRLNLQQELRQVMTTHSDTFNETGEPVLLVSPSRRISFLERDAKFLMGDPDDIEAAERSTRRLSVVQNAIPAPLQRRMSLTSVTPVGMNGAPTTGKRNSLSGPSTNLTGIGEVPEAMKERGRVAEKKTLAEKREIKLAPILT